MLEPRNVIDNVMGGGPSPPARSAGKPAPLGGGMPDTAARTAPNAPTGSAISAPWSRPLCPSGC